MTVMTKPFGSDALGNTKFAQQGDLITQPYHYDDAIGDVRTATGGAATWTLEAYRDTGYIMPFFIYDQADFFQIAVQFPHRKKKDSTVEMHIHYVPMANGAGDVILDVRYHYVSIGEVIPALATWGTAANVTIGITAADQYKHKIATLVATITPTADTVSSILLMTVTNDVSGTYETAKDHGTGKTNFGILYVDAHFKADSIGSDLETSKSA